LNHMALGLSSRRRLGGMQAADNLTDATASGDGSHTSPPPNVATQSPEPCSVPWPDNFDDSEVRLRYQTVTSQTQLEAQMPLEGTVTVLLADGLSTNDKDAARQTWQAREDDQIDEDNPRAKRHLHRLPDFVTTLIIRNIPNSCTQADLQEEWTRHEFPYDYLHLPLDTRNRPLGYAYINFVLPVHASAFYLRWHGRFPTKHHFSKSLSVTVAHGQGTHVNLMCVKGNNLKVGVPALFRGGSKLTDEEVLRVILMAKSSMMQNRFTERRFQ